MCTADSDPVKFKFFPYLMTLSAFFLLVTVGVYSLYPKIMTSNVHLLRRHFSVNMLLAYVILSTIQFSTFEVTAEHCLTLQGFVINRSVGFNKETTVLVLMTLHSNFPLGCKNRPQTNMKQ